MFFYLSNQIGGLLTLIGVFLTAICGLSIIKNHCIGIITQIRADLEKGRTPVSAVANSIALACGSVLMIIPGYCTDAIGILLVIPGIRAIAGSWILTKLLKNNRFKKNTGTNGGGQFAFSEYSPYNVDDNVIEGDFTEHSSDKKSLNDKDNGHS
jgi:UPF0716 protein FxsA